MEQQQYQDILNRLAALETTRAEPSDIDTSDPPLYLTSSDGTPVDPEKIEKIPDLVKDLPIFTGDPNEVCVWLSDAGGLVQLYQPSATSSIDTRNKFHVVCKAIRRKIRGEANDALVASNVNTNWNLIKRTLLTYYGEKRDITTLDHQLMNCQQNRRSLEDYYDEVNRILSLIANQVKTDVRFQHPEACRAMIDMYNEKAIDAFVRGLDGEIGKFLKNYRPDSLASAYSYCISFQNVEFRKSLARPKPPEIPQGPRNSIPLIPQRNNIPNLPPRIPPRNIMQNGKINLNRYHPYIPINNPQPFIRQPFFNKPQNAQSFFRPKPPQFNKNPFQKPEPMEVDPSIRTKMINYSNRPQQSHQNHPSKRPRLFNTETNEKQPPDPECGFEERYGYTPSDDEEYYPEESSTFERYMRNIEAQEPDDLEEISETAELNFLE